MMMPLLNELRERLYKAVKRNMADGILLSGGLDSSILIALTPNIKGFVSSLGSEGSDLRYVDILSKSLNIEYYSKVFSSSEALDSIPEVIRILKTFDLALPNDIATWFGLKLAKEYGANRVMTGDGGDELFAGYRYMHNIDLDDYIPKLIHTMQFSSNRLAQYLGIEIMQPYLDPEFIEFAIKIPQDLKIKDINGKRWGKWILRKAFEDDLPKEIIWRDKTPLEYGSGTNKLRKIIESRISDQKFKEKGKVYPIRFMNKEHLFYYEVYREEIGEIPKPKEGEDRCSSCGAGVQLRASHCQVCGSSPI
ncbi:MAG: asparagine synthase-related protein [bacterium]|nr:asparagine synthase-related protein [bacterium]